MGRFSMSYEDQEEINIRNVPKEEFEKWAKIDGVEVCESIGSGWLDIKIGNIEITLFKEEP